MFSLVSYSLSVYYISVINHHSVAFIAARISCINKINATGINHSTIFTVMNDSLGNTYACHCCHSELLAPCQQDYKNKKYDRKPDGDKHTSIQCIAATYLEWLDFKNFKTKH